MILRIACLCLMGWTFAAANEPARNIKAKEGFKVELLYKVPKETQGSWVSMCTDPKGRLIVSDQYGKLYRVTVPAIGGKLSATKVEKIDLEIGEAQGLLYAFDALYLVRNAKKEKGFYRITDTDGDDKFDKVELLKKFSDKAGEHGPHAVLLGPDNKLYVVVGNQTDMPSGYKSRVPPVWGEDQLLPRIYGRGFMRGVMAPRGWIARTDKDGKTWDVMATGFRNQYDAAFNKDGELFTYDADMEWDVNTPWYRPTRVNHVVDGAEFGWRNGSGKWPAYYPDSLPASVDIGPGSPTGVTFGYGANFPEKYQKAFFISDWSYGKLYAVHLEPSGSTYKGTFEEFISGTPLPLTDLLIHPIDGAMYFAVGGRRVDSGLYRVTHTGNEKAKEIAPNKEGAIEREKRRELEKFHGVKDSSAVAKAWPSLSSKDRFIRNAARVAIEHQPVAQWQEKALEETDPQASIEALLALTRHGNKDAQPKLLEAIAKVDWNTLTDDQKLALLRVYSLAFIRMGEPDAKVKQDLVKKFDPIFPTKNRSINGELCQLLVYLDSPTIATKGVDLLEKAPSQEEQIHLARSLRLAKQGWTPDARKRYFEWFVQSQTYRGGASFSKFIESIKKDAIAALKPDEKKALAKIINKKVKVEQPLFTGQPRDFVKAWTMADLKPALTTGLKSGRDFENGRKMFGAAACYACHQFKLEGGIIGPDLTGSGGRFTPEAMLESIIEPSKEISDQYGSTIFHLKNGKMISGKLANLGGDSYRIITNMFDPGSMQLVKVADVEKIEESPVSMMPPGLINTLNKEEIFDLLAYVLSGGDAKNAMFSK